MAQVIGAEHVPTPVTLLVIAVVLAFAVVFAIQLLVRTWRLIFSPPDDAHPWQENLLDSLAEGIIVFDAQERIVFFSQGAARITGWNGGDARGRPLGDVLRLPERDRQRLTDFLAAPGYTRPLRLTVQGERPVILAVTGARLPAADGDQGGESALVLRDITDEETGRNLHSYFLAHISHEFRTPLSGLIASIELLRDEIGYLSPAEVDELLNSIHLSASGMKALVDNLLESVNIEAGHFTIHRRPTDLNQVFADVIHMMQPLLDRRKQLLSLTEPFQLPRVNADPTRLTQVMINLLSNASKYSPLEGTIDLTLRQQGDALRIAVADRGPGISPAEREELFKRFVRLNARDSEQAGMGLGLSVVKAIVEQHGGQVGVDERPGGGSIFWFSLPVSGGAA
jgi:PAS domain S-box-containing protein